MNGVNPANLANKVKEDIFVKFLGRIEEIFNRFDDLCVSEIENEIKKFVFEDVEQKYGFIEFLVKMMEFRPSISGVFIKLIKKILDKNPEVNRFILNIQNNENVRILEQFQLIDTNDRYWIHAHYKIDPIAEIILKDDLDSLQRIAGEPSFDKNMQISIPKGCTSIYIRIIDYAASVGSLNCFKFLYTINADLSKFIMSRAIEGGNAEIIRLIELKENAITENCIFVAIKGHHNDILDWLLEKYPDFVSKDLYLTSCVKNINIHGLMYVNEIKMDSKFIDTICSYQNSSTMTRIIINHASKYSRFVEACRNGNVEVVKKYMSENTDVNCLAFTNFGKIYKSPTKLFDMMMAFTFPLFEACTWGQTEVVRILLFDPRIDVNKHFDIMKNDDKVGFSFPLLEAASRNHHEIVRLLLQHKDIDINKANQEKEFHTNPLLQAIYNKSTESALLLLEHDGIDINYIGNGMFNQLDYEPDDRRCYSYPLIGAIYTKNAVIVDKLLRFNNIKLDNKKLNVDTPFIQAILSKDLAIIKLFIYHGKANMSDVGKRHSDIGGMKALQIAKEIGDPRITKVLKDYSSVKNHKRQ